MLKFIIGKYYVYAHAYKSYLLNRIRFQLIVWFVIYYAYMLIVDHPAVLSGLSDLGLNFSDISGDSGIPVSLYLTMIYYQLMGCL